MKTPQEWLAIRTYALNDGDGVVAELNKWIAAIQREAYQEGHKDGREQGHEDCNSTTMKVVADQIHLCSKNTP